MSFATSLRPSTNAPANRPIRVLVVDDSIIVRKVLSDAIQAQPDLELAGTAPDPLVARERIHELRPDVLTLDIEMPHMDGLSFLKEIMRTRPMPVIVISSLAQAGCQAALEALRLGAVEVLGKPSGPYSVGELRESLATKIRAAAAARVGPRPAPLETTPPPSAALPAAPPNSAPPPNTATAMVAIGASTGGTEAIASVLRQLPAACPPVVITQHIPPVFSAAFADRLDRCCAMRVKEAADGDRVEPGVALVAPGGRHMIVAGLPGLYRVQIRDGPLVCYQRPSVDVLFASVAKAAGSTSLGVLLTGMGCDGAQGLLAMRQAGAGTIAQDEATCVVYGMPREAAKLGAAAQVLPLGRIASAIVQHRPRQLALAK